MVVLLRVMGSIEVSRSSQSSNGIKVQSSSSTDIGFFMSLSGVWQGESKPWKSGSEPTKWFDCILLFSPLSTIQGQGCSLWKGKNILFHVIGQVDPSSGSFEIVKTHTGDFHNSLQFKGRIDLERKVLTGEYPSGTLMLERIADLPSGYSISSVPTLPTPRQQNVEASPRAPLATLLSPSPAPAPLLISASQPQPQTKPLPAASALGPASAPLMRSVTNYDIIERTSSTASSLAPPGPSSVHGLVKTRHQVLAERLSGTWEGHSVKIRGGESTGWSDMLLVFAADPRDYIVMQGRGQSVWRGDSISFTAEGTVDFQAKTVELTKRHERPGSSASTYVLAIKDSDKGLELIGQTKEFSSSSGASVLLTLKRPLPPDALATAQKDVLDSLARRGTTPCTPPTTLSVPTLSAPPTSADERSGQVVLAYPRGGKGLSREAQKEKYGAFLRAVLLAGDLSSRQLEALSMYRHECNLTEEDHYEALSQHRISPNQWEEMTRKMQSSGKSEDACVVCMDSAINCVLLPCAHYAVCLSCARQLRSCPVCRASISEAKQVYRS